MRDLLVVHGGVDMPTDEATETALISAARAGWLELADPIAAVVTAVGNLESDPLFNAGYGSVLNADGEVEVDAAIADGSTGSIGAVAAVSGLQHPIRVAAEVLRVGGAVLLSGVGARQFADAMGEPTDDLRTSAQIHSWEAFRSGKTLSPFTGGYIPPATETVGCIVYADGKLIVGTSTGGVCGKSAGRIGDSAILGAGHWADKQIAVLCSGEGEAIIKTRLASRVADNIHDGQSVASAVEWAVRHLFDQTGAICAVVAFNAATDELGSAHSGSDFPVLAFDGVTPHLISPHRVVCEPA